MWSKAITSEAISRPLFEEPSSACERIDEWSGPKGFMFGGMCLPAGTYKAMAQQYFDSANLLISDIEHDRLEDYRLANPVLYLYRHWLELMVKEIAGPVREHNLACLANKMDSFLRASGVALPNWVIARFKEIAAIDPDSTAFRYAENGINGEIYVSLPHLKRAMAVLNVVFLSLAESGELPRRSLSMLLFERGYSCETDEDGYEFGADENS